MALASTTPGRHLEWSPGRATLASLAPSINVHNPHMPRFQGSPVLWPPPAGNGAGSQATRSGQGRLGPGASLRVSCASPGRWRSVPGEAPCVTGSYLPGHGCSGPRGINLEIFACAWVGAAFGHDSARHRPGHTKLRNMRGLSRRVKPVTLNGALNVVISILILCLLLLFTRWLEQGYQSPG